MSNNSRISDKRYNLQDFEADFRHYLLAVNKLKPVSVKNYISDFTYFAGWVQTVAHDFAIEPKSSKSDCIAQFTLDILRSYRNHLIHDKYPRRTVNRRLSTLRKFFSFAINQGWIDTNYAKSVHNISKSAKSTSQVEEVSDLSFNLGSFRSDLQESGINNKKIVACMNDVQEFFEIISSTSSL